MHLFQVYQLSSGNKFYYSPETARSVSISFMVSPEDQILSAQLDQEADRKKDQISAWSDRMEDIELPMIPKNLKFDWIGKMINDNWIYSRIIATIREEMMIVDTHHCSGTNSQAETCESREYYYRAAGMRHAYKTQKAFPLWAFILNHLSVFGLDPQKIKDTFHGHNGGSVSSSDHNSLHGSNSFYPPAMYLRNLINNYKAYY